MAEDPYKVLGVGRSASDDEIRKAYRKLAKELHPDLHPGDKKAEERFKSVSAAYHILGDPERRGRFDRGEIDASGAERPEHQFYRQYAEGGGGQRYTSSAGFEDLGDVSDIFADLFGRARGGGGGGPAEGGGRAFRMRGSDIPYRLDVDFLDAVNGAKRRLTMPDGQTLDVTIPAGTGDGTVLRLKGKGGEGIGGGPAGDALIEITVRPHEMFAREGDDIVVELPITIDEAVLGAKVEAPTISGRVNMTIPKGSNTGDQLRLKGKGIKRAGHAPGDQRVRLKVVMPPAPDPELASFLEGWREKHRYDPRSRARSGR